MSSSGKCVERDVNSVLQAYEQILHEKHGKRVLAQRTRNMIGKRGIIGAVERLVTQSRPSTGFTSLAERGETDLTFEAVVLKHPNHFSPKALARSRKRLNADLH
jgi:hypothetical protein